MGIHAPRSDNRSTMARTTAQLQNLKRNRVSGCSKFHFKLNSSRRCCRFQVVDPVAKRSGNKKNNQGRWELEEIIVKGIIFEFHFCFQSRYFIVFSSNFIRWYLRSTSCSLLMPNCPSQLFPKLKSSPCFVTANVWLSPVYSYTTHKILGSESKTYMENRRSVGRDKNTDRVRETKSFMPAATLMTLESLRSDLVRTSRPWKSPRPSCPDVLLPQEYISPYKVAMTVCDAPHATETMGRRISSCEKAFWLIPSTPLPSCPK